VILRVAQNDKGEIGVREWYWTPEEGGHGGPPLKVVDHVLGVGG